jgi:hypothetical protein
MMIKKIATQFYERDIIGSPEYIKSLTMPSMFLKKLTKIKNTVNKRELKESMIDFIVNNFSPNNYYITLQFYQNPKNDKELHRIVSRFVRYIKRRLIEHRGTRILYSEELTGHCRMHIHMLINIDKEDLLLPLLAIWNLGAIHHTRINDTADLFKIAGFFPKAVYAKETFHICKGIYTCGQFQKPLIATSWIDETIVKSLCFGPEGYKVLKDYQGVEPYSGSQFREIVTISEQYL